MALKNICSVNSNGDIEIYGEKMKRILKFSTRVQNLNIIIDAEKLTQWSKEIYETAVAHGWHEEKHSPKHYLGLVMTEVAEAVEADRKSRRAKTNLMENVMKAQSESKYGLTQQWYDTWFELYYDEYVKGGIEEEFADIVIRLLDMAYDLYGDNFQFETSFGINYEPRKDILFIVSAWHLVRYVVGEDMNKISDSIVFVYKWAALLDIDLDQHIEWKMRYNALRDYKHGGKKY